MKIIFNGQLTDADDPQVSADILNPPTESVFETFAIKQGRVPGTIKQHCERLFASAAVLEFEVPPTLTQKFLEDSLQQLLSTLDLSKNYRCKMLVSAAYWWIRAEVLPPLSATIYTHGVVVDEAMEERDFAAAKWSSPIYQKYFSIQKKSGSFETLFFDKTDNLLEGNISNVIAVLDGVLVSPNGNVLPGITVRSVLAQAALLGFKTEFRAVSREELEQASEIFITNAIKGLVPVLQWKQWSRSSSSVYDQLSV